MPRIAGKKGVLPKDPSRPRINLGNAIRGTAPAQAHFGHIPVIGMLGNDVWGDCVDAACGHLGEAWTFFGQGRETEVTTAQALAMYGTVAGFNPDAGPPGVNPTDVGSTIQAGLEVLQKTGIAGVRAAAFGELDITNVNQWQQALAWLGPLVIGVGVSRIEEQRFNEGQVWVPNAEATPEDHCVVLTGYQPGMYWCWTWGSIQGMTPAWFEQNVYEIWGVAGVPWVSSLTGKDIEGVDLAVFGQEFEEITGQPDPFTSTIRTFLPKAVQRT